MTEKRPEINFESSAARFGYINKQGDLVIGFNYDHAESFSNGLAAVGIKQAGSIRYGYIDRRGNFAIYPKFDTVTPFIGNITYARIKNVHGYINKSGDFVWKY